MTERDRHPSGASADNQAELSNGVPLVFDLSGMDCAECARGIERTVREIPGVASTTVSFGTAKLRVVASDDTDAVTLSSDVVRAVGDAGYGARIPTARDAAMPVPPWWRAWMGNARLRAAAAAGVLIVLAWLLGRLPAVASVPSLLSLLGYQTEEISLLPLLGYAAAVLVGGAQIARSGFRTLVRSHTLDINLLMTVAVVGAIAINEWAEAAAVVFLFGLGEGLEGLTVDRARNSIRSLLHLTPLEAVRKGHRGPEQVAVEDLEPHDIVIVRPGERIPADGLVVTGASSVDQAAITGESMPVTKVAGSDVYAGTMNGRGYLEVVVRHRAEDATLARIGRLIEEAQEQRAPTERFVDRFSRYYTPAVFAAAVLVALVPPLTGQPLLPWLYRALVLLVVSCPCALVISTPVAIVAALGRASAFGVLIKGGEHLEQAGGIRAVAFDKTGTLTIGRPEVVAVRTVGGYEPEELIALAAVIEERSEHPLAAAVLHRREHEMAVGACDVHGAHAHDHDAEHIHLYPHDESEADLSAREVSDFEAITGRGARASLDGRTCYVGSPRLFDEMGVNTGELRGTVEQWQDEGRTVLLVGGDTEVYGAIAVADRPRPHAREALQRLRQAGVRRITMLTGDNERTARSVARELGVDEYRAGLLPEQKVGAVRELLAARGRVAMVGDGVNDAPALATATVGVAMGAAGSDTAIETADIALMGDDLGRLAFVIGLSRRALRIIRANIAFALAVKALVIGLTFLGLTSLWLAILADTGATLLVVANSMRLLRYQPWDGSDGPVTTGVAAAKSEAGTAAV